MRISSLKWPVVGVLCGCLLWYAIEIIYSFYRTRSFKPLSILFGVLLIVIGAEVVRNLLHRASSVLRIALGLIGLNIGVAVLAVWTALKINPSYNFVTPLLEFSFLLLRQFRALG